MRPDTMVRPFSAEDFRRRALIDRARIETLERRAWATDHLPSCMRRAALLRDRGAMTESSSVHRFACGRREANACAAVALFEEWELAPAVDVPSADALP